jgi:hypothetical protein
MTGNNWLWAEFNKSNKSQDSSLGMDIFQAIDSYFQLPTPYVYLHKSRVLKFNLR